MTLDRLWSTISYILCFQRFYWHQSAWIQVRFYCQELPSVLYYLEPHTIMHLTVSLFVQNLQYYTSVHFVTLLLHFCRGKPDYWMGYAPKSCVPHCWSAGLLQQWGQTFISWPKCIQGPFRWGNNQLFCSLLFWSTVVWRTTNCCLIWLRKECIFFISRNASCASMITGNSILLVLPTCICFLW